MIAYVWFSVFGLSVGSFLNVIIYRLPRGFGIGLPRRSYCVACKKPLTWFENLPLLSYIALQGKCRSCGTSFGLRHLVVEVMTSLIFVATYQRFGLGPEFFYFGAFASLLIAITFIDIDFRIIPDELSFLGIVVGVAASRWIVDHGFLESALGLISGGGSFWLLSIIYEKVRHREGLGFGDVKMLAMIGAFLGPKGVLLTVLISSLVGSIVGIVLMVVQKGNLKMAVPYGPFLAIGALVTLFWNNELLWIW